MNTRALAIFTLFAASQTVAFAQHSNYVGQEGRDIKALAPSEVGDLIAGRGMGLARAAELNGYPGPMHVLELGSRLALSEEQESETKEIFARMQKAAKALGAQIVEAERSLDLLFREKRADSNSVTSNLNKIAALQASVRDVHLQAHLEQAKLLTPQQIANYMRLRGYAAGSAHHNHQHKH